MPVLFIVHKCLVTLIYHTAEFDEQKINVAFSRMLYSAMCYFKTTAYMQPIYRNMNYKHLLVSESKRYPNYSCINSHQKSS